MNQARPRRSALSKLLDHPYWLGATGLITIAALIVAVIQLTKSDVGWSQSLGNITGDCNAQGDSNAVSCNSTPEPGPPSRPAGDISGDCNAQGSNNRVSCKVYPPAPASIGDVKMGWAGHYTFLFEGVPGDLPIPPQYPPAEVRNHCDEWYEWLASERRVYTMYPQVWMSMLSGQNDQVVVVNVEATVFKKRLIENDNLTILVCQYGADGVPGSIVTVDVGTGRTDLLDQADENPEPAPMPPAALVLNGTGYDGAIVRIKSSEGFLYSGRVTVTALINNKEKKIEFGSEEQPFRWVGGPVETYPKMDNDTRYDWNPKIRQWVPNLNVADVYPQ